VSDDRKRVLEDSRQLIGAGQLAEAVALLELWVATATDDAVAWALLAAARSRAGDWPRAEETARRVMRLTPESARAWSNWGIALRKLGRTDEAEKAQRKALSLDAGSETAKRELRKLQHRAPREDDREACPECGEPVFATDTQCLSCGADLVAARAAARRAADARARAEAARREATRLQAAEREVEGLRAAGRDDEEVFGELRHRGWEERDVRALLGIADGVWVVALPEGRHAFVESVEDARRLRDEALHRVSELRAQIRSINQEIGEIRSSAHASQVASRPGAGHAPRPEQDDLAQRESIQMLEGTREDAQALIRDWEQTIEALDSWIARSY